jgi:hypothetical protein
VADELRRVERTRRYGAWRDWFTPEDVEALRPSLQPYLDRYYRGGDWSLNEAPRIEPDHSSRYVERVVDEKRRLMGLVPLGRTNEPV